MLTNSNLSEKVNVFELLFMYSAVSCKDNNLAYHQHRLRSNIFSERKQNDGLFSMQTAKK